MTIKWKDYSIIFIVGFSILFWNLLILKFPLYVVLGLMGVIVFGKLKERFLKVKGMRP